MSRQTIVIDLDACLGCHACATVCKQEHLVGLGSHWNKVLDIGPTGRFPDLELYYLPVLCQQCDNPTCVRVCPTGASYKRDDGVVLVKHDRCIGCKYCVMACPYGVRQFNEDAGIIEKCTLCAQRPDAGTQPVCVRACPAQCRAYGDLDDPDSEVSRISRAAGDHAHRLLDLGNHPAMVYILHKHAWRNG